MKFTTPATFIQSISCHLGSWSLDRCAGVLAGIDHPSLDAALGGYGLDGNGFGGNGFGGGVLNVSYPVHGKQRKSFTDSLSRMEQRPAAAFMSPVLGTSLEIISEQFRQLRSGRYRLKPTPLT